MKILFFGDSITDMDRKRDVDDIHIGNGFVFFVAGDIKAEDPSVEILNRGVSGDKIVDLYARIKKDVWNQKPDILSILVGVNDVAHEIFDNNGVEFDRFIKIYDMLIADTLKVLPNTKIIICEPFILKGKLTEEHYEKFLLIKDYAKEIKYLAEKYSLEFLPLQDAFNKVVKQTNVEYYLYDGVHPNIAGAKLIADEWLKLYKDKIKKNFEL